MVVIVQIAAMALAIFVVYVFGLSVAYYVFRRLDDDPFTDGFGAGVAALFWPVSVTGLLLAFTIYIIAVWPFAGGRRLVAWLFRPRLPRAAVHRKGDR